jgi:dihydrofolate synthase/folylpolyglutamate synthase
VETTFFESMLAIACLQFAKAGTEAVILEVGLGGRLDATTAVPTTTNVITEISLEHTEILGDTVELVAAEKAGTIRSGVPLIAGVDPKSPAGAVIRRIANERGAPWSYVPPPEGVTATAAGLSWAGYEIGVLGRHQAHNAALAIAAVSDLPDEVIRRGLAATRQPGCCEPRGSNPTVVLDGAHTTESIEATLRAVEEHLPGTRPTLVFALAEDKDLDRIVAAMAPRVGSVFCTRVDDKRGRTAEELAAHPVWAERARALPDAGEALKAARDAAGPDGLVLATGSLYLAGALRSYA